MRTGNEPKAYAAQQQAASLAASQAELAAMKTKTDKLPTAAVVDLASDVPADIRSKVNELLAALRTAGILP